MIRLCVCVVQSEGRLREVAPTPALYTYETVELELSLATISIETDESLTDYISCPLRLSRGSTACWLTVSHCHTMTCVSQSHWYLCPVCSADCAVTICLSVSLTVLTCLQASCCVRYGHSCHDMLIGNHMHSVKMCHFWWSLVTFGGTFHNSGFDL